MIFISTSSCVFKPDEVKLKGYDLASSRGGSGPSTEVTVEVTAITLENDQLKIQGSELDSVTAIKLGSDSLESRGDGSTFCDR